MVLLSVLLAASPNNIVVADVGLHVVGVGYQRTVTAQLAVQLTASLYVPWTHSATYVADGTPEDLAGVVGRLRLFVYPAAHAPTGFWLSPFFQGGLANGTFLGEKLQGTVYAGGASAGWAWLPWRHVHLAVGAGLQYAAGSFPKGQSFGRFHPQVDLNAGFAF